MKNILYSKKYTFFFLAFVLSISFSGCVLTEADKMKKQLKDFISDYEKKIIPLEKEYRLASYTASITGAEEDFKKSANLEVMYTRILANKQSFETLKLIKTSNLITDPILKRQLDILYNTFLPKQIDEQKQIEIIMLENELNKRIANFRPTVNDEEVTDNKIDEVLTTSVDSVELAKFWRASKKVGRLLDDDLKKLITMRNEAATQLGFANYYEMMLITSGINPEQLDNIFDELDMETRGAFTGVKDQIDSFLSKRYQVPREKLMPWHYQNRFFQEAPVIFSVNFDNYYKDKDIVGLAGGYFKSIGLDITKVLDKSDLFEKKGKTQLFFTTAIDKEGDVRIITNLKNNQYSMYRILYEAGFAAYLKNIDKDLPYVLRQPANYFTVDAVGEMFSRLSQNPDFLHKQVGISDDEQAKIKQNCLQQLRISKLVFCRWAQVMYRFEKALYDNPNQNLNSLWWDMVENYQMLHRPIRRNEPDWASKGHLISMPCTYHNYMLGDLLASQLSEYITTKVTKEADWSLSNEAIGKYLIEKVFRPGMESSWNEMIFKATGDSLSPIHFTKQFVNKK